MGSVTTPPIGDILRRLRESNARLAVLVDNLVADRASAQAAAQTSQQMSSLLSELIHAGQCTRQLPERREPEVQEQLDAYRKSVEHLRNVLPLIHQSLLRERARLEQERTRIESAAAWAHSSRQTL
jgi:hypothetical protein